MNDAMTVDSLVDILSTIEVSLSSYVQDPTRYTDCINIPTPAESVDPADEMKYKIMFDNIFVVGHDYGNLSGENGTHITFVRRNIYDVVKAAKELLPNRSVQFGCNFVDMPKTNLHLGHGRFSDFAGHYFPSVFVLTKDESKKFSKEIR